MIEPFSILVGAVGGAVRSLVGYMKAHFKHHERFNPGKFVFAVILGSGVGGAIEFFRASATSLEIIIAAIAGVVVIDEILQAIFLRRSKEAAANGGKALNTGGG